MVKKIIIGVVCFIVLVIVGCGVFYYSNTSAVGKDEVVVFEVSAGAGQSSIIKSLKEKDLIKNEFVAKVFAYLHSSYSFQAGTYELNKNMDLEAIYKKLYNGEVINDSITLTFVEGKRLVDYVDVISNKFNYSKEDIMKVLTDKEYLQELIDKNWFITSEILNNKLYYALEGYLYPDTYQFKKDASIKDIINKMINTLGSKLESYKEKIEGVENTYSVHELLTLASIIEQEAASTDDRLNVSGVFYNRLNLRMSLGSDVTSYYGAKKTFQDALSDQDLIANNPYNTRVIYGLPVGPICNMSLSSINAAINPTKNDYLFFVSDIKKKVYFSRTAGEQNEVIQKLKSNDLWG